MKKMLLTSNGLSTPEIREVFHEMTGNDGKNVRVLFIPTASRTEEELVKHRFTVFGMAGNTTFYNLTHPIHARSGGIAGNIFLSQSNIRNIYSFSKSCSRMVMPPAVSPSYSSL